MSTSEATVSVVIPTYNRPKLVKRAVQSVLHQTYGEFELIVVDDGSETDVEASLQSFADDRLTVLRHEENRNASAARNTGIRESDGEYIAFLDDDDVWLPWKLDYQVRALEATDDGVGMLISAFYVLDRFDNDFRVFIDEPHDSNPFSGIPSRWLVKREAVCDVGLFDVEMPTMQDLEFSARLLDAYDAVYDDYPTTVYYQRTERKNIEGREKLLAKHGEKMTPGYKYNQLLSLSTSYLEDSDFRNARRQLRDAMSLRPTDPKLYVLFALGWLEVGGLYETIRDLLRAQNVL